MPRVKIDYIVSFSSEDPENQARNLLAWDVSKKKWLCSKGEPSCSVVLQLAKAVKISAVHIGAHHAALVEVLVGRSENPNEPFQVLVPSSVFLTPSQSRREESVERVRSFSDTQLAGARRQRWDRLRLVCSQPYNKHCKYGLSFVQIYEPEGVPSAALPPRLLALRTESDEDDFRPGELFAEHSHQAKINERETGNSTNTGAQIRRATSQALKNIPDSSTKLVKTPISKTTHRRGNADVTNDYEADRRRNSLVYTDDDERQQPKIDSIVQRHEEERSDEDRQQSKRKGKLDIGANKTASNEEQKKIKPEEDGEVSRPGGSGSGTARVPPHQLMRGVVLVLSGYQNPRRARVRTAALAMGAVCRADWGPGCTHLVCAFPSTPKLRRVRAAAGGARVPAVTAEWVEQTAARRRRLPAEWFACEPARRVPPRWDELADADAHRGTVSSECDTDDEIEKALHERKKQSVAPSSSRVVSDELPSGNRAADDRPANVSCDSDVAFVRDERIKDKITIKDSDSDRTDEETAAEEAEPAACRALPELFSGRTFALDAQLGGRLDARLLARYVRAYGGVVVEESGLKGDGGVDYVLCGDASARASARASGARRVRADWVWRCHADGRLCPLGRYALD